MFNMRIQKNINYLQPVYLDAKIRGCYKNFVASELGRRADRRNDRIEGPRQRQTKIQRLSSAFNPYSFSDLYFGKIEKEGNDPDCFINSPTQC